MERCQRMKHLRSAMQNTTSVPERGSCKKIDLSSADQHRGIQSIWVLIGESHGIFSLCSGMILY
jgi:hypothetical protein